MDGNTNFINQPMPFTQMTNQPFQVEYIEQPDGMRQGNFDGNRQFGGAGALLGFGLGLLVPRPNNYYYQPYPYYPYYPYYQPYPYYPYPYYPRRRW